MNRTELSKLIVLGQWGLKATVKRQDCLQLDIFKAIKHAREQIKKLSMHDVGFMMKGLAFVYLVQVQSLELDTKSLLGQINGDYAWNHFIKKQMKVQIESPRNKQNKKRKQQGEPGLDDRGPRPFNIMDAKQILAFTAERLNFLSSNHNSDKLQLSEMSGNNSAVKDFNCEGDPAYHNPSSAHGFRTSAPPDDQNFVDILDANISDFMQGGEVKAGDDAAAMLHDFFNDDDYLKQMNDAIYRQDGDAFDPVHDLMISLSLESFHQEDGQDILNPEKGKRDIRLNKKFQDFMLQEDRNLNVADAPQRAHRRDQTQAIQDDLVLHQNDLQILNYEPKKKDKAMVDAGIFGNPFQDLNLNIACGDKEEIFDNFLTDLFTNNLDLDLGKLGLVNKRGKMTLDQSLLMTTAKKQSLNKLLNTESSGGLLSNLQALPDSMASGGLLGQDFSNGLGALGHLPGEIMDDDAMHEFQPVHLQFPDDGPNFGDFNQLNQNGKKVTLADVPSLREFVTSNDYTDSRISIAEKQAQLLDQIMQNPVMRGHLKQIQEAIAKNEAKAPAGRPTKFSAVFKGMLKEETTSAFQSLMVLAKAGILNLKYEESTRKGGAFKHDLAVIKEYISKAQWREILMYLRENFKS